MSKVPLKNMQGESKGEYEIPDELLIYAKGTQAMKDAAVAHRNNQRAGTASTLTKAEVSGSGRKPWKQKGTGNARVGTKRNPIWRGGGVAFGPNPRAYNQKLTKKAGWLAFRRAFSEKIAAGQVLVVEEISMAEPKTKVFADFIKKLDTGSRILVVTETLDRNVALSARNMASVELATAKDVNTFQLLRSPEVVIDQRGMEILSKRLNPEKKADNETS